MSPGWQATELLEPIAGENPCGQNLEDTALLASFDSYRLYGRNVPIEPPPGAGGEGGEEPKTLEDRDSRPPDWQELKTVSLDTLGQSKDLRVLAHLAAALLRTDGLPAFLDTLSVASQWLEAWWEETYPPHEGDGILRRNALNCFADPMAVVDRVRRAPLVANRQVGVFSLRDIEIATGQGTPARGEERPDEAQINAAFAAMPVEELTGLIERVSNALRGLKSIEGRMRSEFGAEAAPEFGPLHTNLGRIEKILKTQLGLRPGAQGDEAGAGSESQEGGHPGAAAGFSGVVRSREEAVRALDAVSMYFRTYEPSSPVPLLCDRAKSLVSRSFLEVLEEIAPEALATARAVGGIKD